MLLTQLPTDRAKIPMANRMALAPLAGVSDIPFRRICSELGAGLTYVEMLSATALTYGNRKTFAMLARHPSEKILGVQVTGQTAELVGRAVAILTGEGFETIDVNMGCPVKKVVNSGCGSAILKDPERVAATLQAARAATNVPISAKIRLGYTRDLINVETIGSIVAKNADMLTIHGRTRSETYDTAVDLAGIRAGISAARAINPQVVCLSNGDVFAPGDAARHLAETGSDGVMVSRGALGNPWIFRQLVAEQLQQPTIQEWREVVQRHIAYQAEHFGNTSIAAVLIRKHLLWYSKGYPGGKKLREELGSVATLSEAQHRIDAYCDAFPPDLRRFESPERRGASVSDTSEMPQPGYDPKYEMDRIHDRGVGDEDLQPVDASITAG